MNADTKKYKALIAPPKPPYKNWVVMFDTSKLNKNKKIKSLSINIAPQSFILLVSE